MAGFSSTYWYLITEATVVDDGKRGRPIAVSKGGFEVFLSKQN